MIVPSPVVLSAAIVAWAASAEAFVQPAAPSRPQSVARFASSTNGANGESAAKPPSPKKEDAPAAPAKTVGTVSADDPYSFVVPVLGDLHIDPRKMEDYEVGRGHILSIIEDAKKTLGRCAPGDDDCSRAPDSCGVALVSLGDLGESKNCEHNPDNPFELFAGTSKCHEMAADFLGSFGVPYEVIGGNHDLEGIDEFDTDSKNLRRFLQKHGKETPQFCRQVAEKTLLVGLCSTIFREAKYTSHEVIIDDEQIRWFEGVCKEHPADEGWRIFVFSHAPPK